MTGPNGGGVVNQGAGVLDQAAKEIRSAQDDLTAIAATLRSQIDPMVGSWKGSGANAFFEFHNAWHEKEKKIVDILTNFSNAIGATHTTTTQVDSEESANYKKTLDRLG